MEKRLFFCVKSRFFTRNTPKICAHRFARRDYFKCAPYLEILDPPLLRTPILVSQLYHKFKDISQIRTLSLTQLRTKICQKTILRYVLVLRYLCLHGLNLLAVVKPQAIATRTFKNGNSCCMTYGSRATQLLLRIET